MSKLNLALIVAAVAAAIYVSTLSPEAMRSMQAGILSALSPFLRTGTAVQENIGAVGKRLQTLDELEVENKELHNENRELRAENSLLRDLKEENGRLRMMLDFRERSDFKLVPARIIARDSSTWWNTVRIDRGFEDGVEADQPVVTDTGLVGKTTTVSKNEAIVVLVTDESCRIGARIEGTREQGIVTGFRVQENESEGLLQMNFLSKNAEIEPGQLVITAGVVHGSFPPGLAVGRVKEFKRRSLDGQAIVEPAVQLATTQDVFVLVEKK
ncbi:MAG: rod shape-determining protein MreC [Terrimicrobiaceae bacterium]|jgi:rod shape-determining protein MreC